MATFVPLVVSVVALAVSLFALFDSRRRDRRDLFIRINESLLSKELQRGRALIFDRLSDEASVLALSEEDFRSINHALATYDALGLYVRRRYVDEVDVMDMWAEPVVRAWRQAQPFVIYRAQTRQHNNFWPHLRFLAGQSERWLAKREIELPQFPLPGRHTPQAPGSAD